MPAFLIAAALAAQQLPLPADGLRPLEFGMGADGRRCAEQQYPEIERVLASMELPRIMALTPAAPELSAATARLRGCFAQPPAGPDHAALMTAYYWMKATSASLRRSFERHRITPETLARLSRSHRILWLSGGDGRLRDDLRYDYRRRRIPPERHKEVTTYLAFELLLQFLEIGLQPPARRAVFLGGQIEASDYPVDAAISRAVGTGGILFEVAPDGTVGRCLVVRTIGSESFGRAACRAVSRRYRFTPARDSTGRPVSDVVGAHIHWRLPGI